MLGGATLVRLTVEEFGISKEAGKYPNEPKHTQRLYFITDRWPTLDEALAESDRVVMMRSKCPDMQHNDTVAYHGLKGLKDQGIDLRFSQSGQIVRVDHPDYKGEWIEYRVRMNRLTAAKLTEV